MRSACKSLTILMLILSLFCIRVNAQIDKFTLGVEIGVNYSNASEETAPLKKVCPILPKVGVVMNYDITNHLYLHSALFYSMKGLKSKGSGNKSGMDVENAKVTSYQHVILVPVLLGYGFDIEKSNLSFLAGPYFAYGIGGTTKAKGLLNGQDFEKESDTFGRGKILNRFDSGLNIKAIWAINHVFIGLSYELGLVEIGNINIVGAELDYKNRVASLTVGYNF